ncbi:hypothetical protein Esi_0465_0008 [Ectocarpus siliculosus]|uniref:Uncharacterized protein n=1 Tax=Ectocarpus siliculosus TaxID=2880 RepID=D7G255_ECTSI|nr:hypothetical protein Esi_0465_0008 [Ectocarpus siliculosus]|eukprot:CBJ33358.1 hypothetical protein Esi_0465_0008 [Ectocarpus siliculosus]
MRWNYHHRYLVICGDLKLCFFRHFMPPHTWDNELTYVGSVLPTDHHQWTNMLRMEPTSAACLEQVAEGPPEGSSRLYAELEDRLKIFDKGNHSMFKGLEDGHNSLWCVRCSVTLHHETRAPSWRAPALRCDNRG